MTSALLEHTRVATRTKARQSSMIARNRLRNAHSASGDISKDSCRPKTRGKRSRGDAETDALLVLAARRADESRRAAVHRAESQTSIDARREADDRCSRCSAVHLPLDRCLSSWRCQYKRCQYKRRRTRSAATSSWARARELCRRRANGCSGRPTDGHVQSEGVREREDGSKSSE